MKIGAGSNLLRKMCVAGVGALCACTTNPKLSYRDAWVKVEEIEVPRVVTMISPHSSGSRKITVNGLVYKNVIGTGSCYISIPEINSLIFVTRDDAERATFHFFNTATREMVNIDAGYTAFGGQIGSPGLGSVAVSDAIDKVDPPRVVLVSQQMAKKTFTTVNLKNQVVEKSEVFVYDVKGNFTHHYIDGKEAP